MYSECFIGDDIDERIALLRTPSYLKKTSRYQGTTILVDDNGS